MCHILSVPVRSWPMLAEVAPKLGAHLTRDLAAPTSPGGGPKVRHRPGFGPLWAISASEGFCHSRSLFPLGARVTCGACILRTGHAAHSGGRVADETWPGSTGEVRNPAEPSPAWLSRDETRSPPRRQTVPVASALCVTPDTRSPGIWILRWSPPPPPIADSGQRLGEVPFARRAHLPDSPTPLCSSSVPDRRLGMRTQADVCPNRDKSCQNRQSLAESRSDLANTGPMLVEKDTILGQV